VEVIGSSKRLYVHGLPLVLLSVVVTVATLVGVHGQRALHALAAPAFDVGAIRHSLGGASVQDRNVPVLDVPVVRISVPGDSLPLDGATQLGESVVLQQAVTRELNRK
jgi:hypothetical protein